MKYIRSHFSDWRLVTDDEAEKVIDRMHERATTGITKEQLRSRYVKEVEEYEKENKHEDRNIEREN